MQPSSPSSLSRRRLLQGLGARGGLTLTSGLARARVRPLALYPAAGDGEIPRTLVLLQLAGGNDGLSTVVPYADEAYPRLRRVTGIPASEVLPLDERRGLHPELVRLHALFDAGDLAIVEGVGYPNGNRSHFKSFEIWHAADPRGRLAGSGWVGRLCAELYGEAAHPSRLVNVGSRIPYSLHSLQHPAASFRVPAGYRWIEGGEELAGMEPESPESSGHSPLEAIRGVMHDARSSSAAIRQAALRYRPRVEYPGDVFADSLRVAAALIQGRIGTRVISVELGGFDTHNDQRGRHDALMRTLDGALSAFLDDLHGTDAGPRTVVLAFSEFGRRAAENGSRGTDHGKAGPVFLAGEPVRGGLYGESPSLEDLDEDGDPRFSTDFRSVYATLIDGWFGASHERVLGAEYPRLPLFAT